MAKLVRHLTSNEEIVSSNLAEGIFFAAKPLQILHILDIDTVMVKGLTGLSFILTPTA
ncbi:unnamed protein product [Debaryomyces tyrocola]|nr:unnamed protein product [Debaryomyces tyrocola]